MPAGAALGELNGRHVTSNGKARSVGSLVVREVDNTWVLEVLVETGRMRAGSIAVCLGLVAAGCGSSVVSGAPVEVAVTSGAAQLAPGTIEPATSNAVSNSVSTSTDGGVFPEGWSPTVAEPDLDSSYVVTTGVPASAVDVTGTRALEGPVTSSTTGVSVETEASSSTVQLVASTTLFVLVDSQPTPIQRKAGEPLRVVLTGDSISDQWAPYLEWILGSAATIEHRHLWGTALCDWFAESGDNLGLEYLKSWDPHLYIVDHGGNGMTPCMADAAGLQLVGEAYTAKYLADTEYVMELALRTGSRVLLVDQPVSRGDYRSGTGEIYRSMPGRHPGGLVRFFSTWPALTPGGQFVQSAPCEATEPGCVDGRGELREPPPNVHLEALGAWRYAVAIVDELVAAGWVDAELVDVTDRVMP